MNTTEFAKRWYYAPGKCHFRDYPRLLDSENGVPGLEASLEEIGEYQRRLWANRKKALLIIVQGSDTSGKDSLIRTLATYVDPAGFHAWSFGRPEGSEKRHQYEAFAEQAIAATHTDEAPWLIVPGDRKPQARAIVAGILSETLKRMAPEYPKERSDVLEQYRHLLAGNGAKNT